MVSYIVMTGAGLALACSWTETSFQRGSRRWLCGCGSQRRRGLRKSNHPRVRPAYRMIILVPRNWLRRLPVGAGEGQECVGTVRVVVVTRAILPHPTFV